MKRFLTFVFAFLGCLLLLETTQAKAAQPEGVYQFVYIQTTAPQIPVFDLTKPYKDVSYRFYVPKTITAFHATSNVFRRARDGLTCSKSENRHS